MSVCHIAVVYACSAQQGTSRLLRNEGCIVFLLGEYPVYWFWILLPSVLLILHTKH